MNLSEKQVEQYASLIAKRIEMMEENWQQPWIDNNAGRPRNLDGRVYDKRSLNSLMLSVDTQINGYETSVYTTFKKAKEEDIQILKGSRGVLVSYLGKYIKDNETGVSIDQATYNSLTDEQKLNYSVRSYIKTSTVFNLDQTNIKESRPELWERIKSEVNPEIKNVAGDHKFIDRSLEDMIQEDRWIIPIKHSSEPRAYYSPKGQFIHLPKIELFKSSEHYYSTALHEMAHSTEVPLKRSIKGYAREELVAELSASLVANEYNYPKTIQDSNVQYLKSWLKSLREDPSYLKTILEDAHKASNFILNEVEESRSKIVARMNYLDNSGKIEYSDNYTDIDKFIKDLRENIHYGVPMTHNILTEDSEMKQKVRQALLGEYGIDPQEDIQRKQEVENRETDTLKEDNLFIGAKMIWDKATMRIYANPSLMTTEYMIDNHIDDKKILSLAKERESIIQDYAVSENPNLLVKQEDIEDKIRSMLREPYNVPELPSRDQKEQLISDHIERVTNEPLTPYRKSLVNIATYQDIYILVKEPNTPENRDRLIKDGVDFQENGSVLQFEARIRYKEGWTLENTKENQDLLSSLSLNYTKIGKDRLFVASTEGNIGELVYHTDKLQAIFGIGTLPKLKENTLEERLRNNPNLSAEDREALLSGKTVFRPESSDSDINKVYYIDKDLHQIRTIDSKDLFVPKELSGISLNEEQMKNLRQGKPIVLFDQENHVYHRTQVDMREHNHLKTEYKTSLHEEFKTTPTVESPDYEKERYIALKGATGINDIWGREGVKMERDSFLDRYNVQETYREFLLLNQNKEPGLTLAQNKEIKEVFRQLEEQNNISYKR